jgi:tetratricopeptide (TPR) repeat protein
MRESSNVGLTTAQLLRSAENALKERMYRVVYEVCNDVISRDPECAQAYFLKGLASLQDGNVGGAARDLGKASHLAPRDINYLLSWGQALAKKGAHGDAEDRFRQALKLTPGHPEVLRALGDSLMLQRRFSEAMNCFDEVLIQKPRDADSFNRRGYVLQQLGNQAAALGNFSRALLLQPFFPEAANNRGNALHSLGRHEEALKDFDRAISQRPNYVLPYSNKSNTLTSLKRYDEALECCDKSIGIEPNFAAAHNNRGFVLQKIGRHGEAIESLKRAVALQPGYGEALNNLGFSLQQLRRFDEALGFYEEAIRLQPEYAEAIWNRGLLKLLRGDMPAGWRDMEWRWKCKEFLKKPGQADIVEWSGQDLQGRSIAVFAEQGFGDLFQFCRYLPKLIERGARVTLVIPRKLHSLLSTLDQRIRIWEAGVRLEGVDFQCMLLSLPDRFKTELATIPNAVPYLNAESTLAEKWKKTMGKDGFKVGISWQGNPSGFVDFGRSMPLAAFAPLSDIPGVRLISIQFQHGTEQLKSLPSGMKVEELAEFNTGESGFIDTAAVMKSLDLIITTDSAPAHLAGAMNMPVWVMLRAVPDWRWLLDRSDSPWYPSMKLFRQEVNGDWGQVIRDVAKALATAASK